MRRPDVVLIHPPSVFDFRDRTIVYGPISDVIPSSPVFEMYPVGFLTLAAFLRRHGYRVKIVNLALRMMRSRRFRPERFLRRLRPKLMRRPSPQPLSPRPPKHPILPSRRKRPRLTTATTARRSIFPSLSSYR